MRLNRLGTAHIISPARTLPLRFYVAPLLERLGGTVEGGRVLEVGCGQGLGAEIIKKRFGAATVNGVDLDGRIVARAKGRLARRNIGGIEIAEGDATHLDFDDRSFDAVFDFGAIHLIQEWEQAVGEVARVLKPGGRFYFEEMSLPSARILLNQTTEKGSDPRRNGFNRKSFLRALEDQGLAIKAVRTKLPTFLYWLTSGVADLIGVARLDDRTINHMRQA